MSSDNTSAVQDPVIEKGDLFVCDAQPPRSFLVVSRKHADVNLVGKDELCDWTRLKLRLCVCPKTNVVFVRHYKRSYRHIKKDSPDYERLKPQKPVPPPKPEEFDARELVKVGDVFEDNDPWSRGMIRTATATKVTKCYVTLDIGQMYNGERDLTRIMVQLGERGPELHNHYTTWRLQR
jgi:hypothetical protein